MPLLKNGQFVDDAWVFLSDEDPLPTAGNVVVSIGRWLESAATLKDGDLKLGVLIESGQSPAQIADDLDALDLVALNFPAYTDGRSYSAARLLRERYGFKGEVRATGNVLIDQYAFMLRCGFDTFEVDEKIDPAEWSSRAEIMTQHYQPAADNIQAIWA